MDKEQIKNEYDLYSPLYIEFQKEIYDFVCGITKFEECNNIDICDIKERPNGQIKSIESIYKNIDRRDKYTDCNNILDIKDIAGIKVICHCDDDYRDFAEILYNKLIEKRYLDVEKEEKGGTENIKNKKSRPSYRAFHITFAKIIHYDGTDIKLFGEIQIRTVMAEAWAVQERKYLYGQVDAEGDRYVLTDSVAEIMRGCEGLWSLVKKKYKYGSETSLDDLKTIQQTAKKTNLLVLQQNEREFNSDLDRDNL